MDDISSCIITGLPISNIRQSLKTVEGAKPYFEYNVGINGKLYEFSFCLDKKCFDDLNKFISQNRESLFSLLVKGKEIKHKIRVPNQDRGYLIHRMDLIYFLKDNNVESLKDKLRRYYKDITEMEYVENEDTMHVKAMKIANDLENMYPNNTNIKEFKMLLHRYNVHSEYTHRKDSLYAFKQKSILELGFIINSL